MEFGWRGLAATAGLAARHEAAHEAAPADRAQGPDRALEPRTRKEDALFKAWLQTHTPAWEEVARKPDPRWKDRPPDVFRAIASPIPEADGFRLFWYESSDKLERDAQARRAALQRAWKALEALAVRLRSMVITGIGRS